MISINIDGGVCVFNAFRKNTTKFNRLVDFIEANCDRFKLGEFRKTINKTIYSEWVDKDKRI
ncbi:hypothetical protein OKQ67_07375 [Clostridioides difficile]|uniref:hypothetical protein n=1 Tax=Clostridioides difficile TaxID=1496 RepID=UPI00136BEF8F|nr:hypothetical protein [Clostridioides difficile]MCF8951871.1 hypothetical protein [Clostridioides difficile]MCW0623984.1 hypothetical protein [Clostridioides difficile]MDM0308056.1 hypothetical protein [Clostridioides difficile]MDM0377626.1 hypothetical protein [Clostridioides difficile]MXQ46076.1 hypothetical protein [Clostridioides difficile]